VKKMAGYYGLTIFISNLALGGQWIQDRQIDIIKSLITILKDAPPDKIKNIAGVAAALHSVLRICYVRTNPPSGTADSNLVATSTRSNTLIALRMLVQESPGPNSLLQATVQQGAAILAEPMGQSIVETTTPFRDGLVNSIYSKPLHALPLQRRIGHVDTITYVPHFSLCSL
jgi:transformation/transcription domain-associated protein